jgi:ABC-2 type transport system permease protein
MTGYTLGYGVFAAIQSILVVAYTRYVLGLDCAGSLLLVMLVMVLLALTAVSMGALASIFANSEFQVMQFIPIVLVPQIFFSGLIPLDTMPWGLGNLGYITPVYYGCTALHKIMTQGAGITKIWPWLAGLLAYMAVLSVLNILALRKYRKL